MSVDIAHANDTTTTKAELAEAITNMAATASRMPAHWADRKAAIHARIDALLDDYQTAVD